MVIRIHQWRPLGLKFSLCVFLKHLFYFRVVLDLQESYEDSTDSFHILHIKIILLIFYINMVHLSLSSIQSLSHVQLFVTLQITARQASLSITNSWRLLKLMSIELVMPSSHLIICHPLLLLPPTPPSIRVFSSESTLRMRWPQYWSFSFNISPSNEHPGLISFRMDWLDLLAVQGTLKSLLQHHSSKASILQCSAFFTVQLSYPYMITGKTIASNRWTFVGKVRSLLFYMLSRLVITFLPRSKHLLTSWLQSPSAMILEPLKIKSDTDSTVSPFISHEVMGTDDMILVFWMLSFKPTFSLSSFTFVKRLFSSSSLSSIKGGVICISEVIDISPGNLNSSLCLCFFQHRVFHDVLCIEVEQAGWQYTALAWSFSYLEPVCWSMSSSNCSFPDLHTGFSRGRSGGLVFPSPSEFPTVYCDPHSQRLWHSQ